MVQFQTIIVPQGQEYQAVCRGAKGANLRIIPIPMGNPLFSQQFEQCLEKQLGKGSIREVVLLGLCGSLTNQHQVGDFLIYQTCKSEQIDRPIFDFDLTDRIRLHLADSAILVNGLECDRLICEVETKRNLAKIHQTTAVDMESYQVRQILGSRNISLGVVRVVSDALDFNLPDLSSANVDGKLIPFRLAIAMGRQPLSSLQLIKNALKGLRSLQECTKMLLNSAP
jgi:Phosphorylase superfamily